MSTPRFGMCLLAIAATSLVLLTPTVVAGGACPNCMHHEICCVFNGTAQCYPPWIGNCSFALEANVAPRRLEKKEKHTAAAAGKADVSCDCTGDEYCCIQDGVASCLPAWASCPSDAQQCHCSPTEYCCVENGTATCQPAWAYCPSDNAQKKKQNAAAVRQPTCHCKDDQFCCIVNETAMCFPPWAGNCPSDAVLAQRPKRQLAQLHAKDGASMQPTCHCKDYQFCCIVNGQASCYPPWAGNCPSGAVLARQAKQHQPQLRAKTSP